MRHLPGFSVAAPALVVLALVTQAGFGQSQSMQQMTPLLLAVHDAPIPFTGSDERLHLVYELWMTNFSSADVAVEKSRFSATAPFSRLSTPPVLTVKPVSPPRPVKDALPLDQLIISFAAQ